jgi:uncharacterized protein YfaS (alpha-2-macroglobulin family)
MIFRRHFYKIDKSKYTNVVMDQLLLSVDQEKYNVGDTCTVKIDSPFTPCSALMTIKCNGIIKTKVFEIREQVTSITLPVCEEYAPNVFIQIDTIGSTIRKNDKGEKVVNHKSLTTH